MNNFFGWVGVVALLLVVPLNILSNTLTPHVQEWWATSTRARASKRIKWIDRQLLGCDLIEGNYLLVIIDVGKSVILGLACAVIGIGLQIIGLAQNLLSAMDIISKNHYLPMRPLEGWQLNWFALGFELFGAIVLLRAWRRLTIVSPYNVRTVRARWTAERIELIKRFNLVVDNSTPQ
jgi:hypothetical protein